MVKKKRKNETIKLGEKTSRKIGEPDPKTITLDRKGILTGPGEKSSDIIQLKKGQEGILKSPGEETKGIRNTEGFKKARDIIGGALGTGEGRQILPDGTLGDFPEGTIMGGGVSLAPNLAAVAGGGDAIGGVKTALNQIVKGSRTGQGGILGINTLSGTSKVSKAAQVGKPIIDTIGGVATNAKTTALSTSLMVKVGLGISAAGTLLGAIGTYPFSGFIKEEALQTLGFGVTSAIEAGDYDGAQKLIDETTEVLNPGAWERLLATIPYVNVVKQLQDFYKAAALKNQQAQTNLDIKREELAGDRLTPFAQEQEANDAIKRERELEEREIDAEYFKLLRDKKFDEAEELLASQRE